MKATPRTSTRRINRSSRRGAEPTPPVPVLFRFPDLVSESAVAESKVADSEAGGSPSENDVSASEKMATQAAPSPQLSSPVVSPAPETEVAAAQLSHSRTTASNDTRTPTSVASAPVVSAPEAVASSATERSWWEHWSSGIVLLLLVVAMVSASIIAFRDSGDQDLALDQAVEEFGIPSLDDIQLDVEGGTLAELSAVSEPTEEAVVPAPLSPTEAALAGDDSLIPESLSMVNTAEASEAEEYSSVVLGQPVAPAGSSADGTGLEQTADASASAGFTLPTVQVSHPSGAAGASPGLYDGARNDGNQNALPGVNGEYAVAEQEPLPSGASGLVAPESTVDAENHPLLMLPTGEGQAAPASTNQLASDSSTAAPFTQASMTREVVGGRQSPAGFSPAGEGAEGGMRQAAPVAETPAAPSLPAQGSAGPKSGPVLTATPEMKTEDYIKAWQEYVQNRYRN